MDSLLAMDAQPDIAKISEAFAISSAAHATASKEISLMTNLPAFNEGQRLYNIIERLSASVDALTTEVGRLRTEVGTLRTEVGTLRTEVGALRTDMNARFERLELRLNAE